VTDRVPARLYFIEVSRIAIRKGRDRVAVRGGFQLVDLSDRWVLAIFRGL
jgi:hypothetical protein